MYTRKNLKSDTGYETDILLENENSLIYEGFRVYKHLVYIPEKNLLSIMKINKISIADYFFRVPVVGDFIEFSLMENPTDDTGELDFYEGEGFPLFNGIFKNEKVSGFALVTNITDTEAEFVKYQMKLGECAQGGILMYKKCKIET